MKLSNTVRFMNSDDDRERLVAEYLQTKIRYKLLHKNLIKIEAGTLEFTPQYHKLLTRQAKYMGEYLKCLEIRAEIEDINLDDYLTTLEEK